MTQTPPVSFPNPAFRVGGVFPDAKGQETRLTLVMDVKASTHGLMRPQVTAWQEDTPVGYLRVALFPRAHRALFLPTPLHFASAFGSACLPFLFCPETGRARALDSLKAENQAALMRVLSREHPDVPLENWLAAGPGARKTALWMEMRRQRHAFLCHHMDKPRVDYVTTGPNSAQGLLHDTQFRGIGFALYVAAARWLGENGYSLYAGTSQTSSAQRMWDHFERLGWVFKQKNRRFIDGRFFL